jgi:hypothetical protein
MGRRRTMEIRARGGEWDHIRARGIGLDLKARNKALSMVVINLLVELRGSSRKEVNLVYYSWAC